MTTAAAANEYRSNIGRDFGLSEGFDEEYLDVEAVAAYEASQRQPKPYKPVDVDHMTTAQRQALNAAMAEWWS